MKPWREVCRPHPDVVKDTFLQSEFAADITAVKNGRGTLEYQDPAAFFERTVITAGMRLLLIQVARRLNGQGAEPVIQLQTGFGGGKTHTMLAVYHLATRTCPLKDLQGIPSLLDEAGLMNVPLSSAAVLDGNARSPGQPWTHGGTKIHTLWGELGYQLGKEEGYALVRDADLSGTSPGKEVLRALLTTFAPCVVLIDELVAYLRQFPEGQALTGGTYDSNLSFLQALTEAVKLVPNAVLLASLPESELEAGSARGQGALKDVEKKLSATEIAQARTSLKASEKTFGRIQALWKPIATEEAFEIVRRRLFEPIHDEAARDEVCRAFAKTYADEGSKVPAETHEVRYHDRLRQAYPIHPEIFDRLFEDWTTLEGFQRTRGVLKLMARVISRLWHGGNKDLMILPSSLPLGDADCRNDLVSYLPPGWDAVLERDIDGPRSVPGDLDKQEPRFGALMAASRVARTLFLATAPSSGGQHKGIRGVERARVVLGCLQPGQPPSTFSDALNRLSDRLHYLNSSGEKTLETTRFWFDTRANLRREMEERKGRFDEQREVRDRIAVTLKAMSGGSESFEGIHRFTPDEDIPDDPALRLVFLPLDKTYSKQDPKPAQAAVLQTIRPNGGKVRHRGNRLVFVAPDEATVGRLRDAARTTLSWASILKDVDEGRLNIDGQQEKLAKEQQKAAEDALHSAARACFRWVICPVQESAADRDVSFETFALATSGGTFMGELDRVCGENELVVSRWSPLHLRDKLRELYWKDGVVAVRAMTVWESVQRYFYLPRLKRQFVLEQTIQTGAASRDFFGTAYGQSGDRFEGFKLGGANVQLDDTLLLIEPEAAAAYEAALRAAEQAAKVAELSPGLDSSTGLGPLVPIGAGGSTEPGKGPSVQLGIDFPTAAPRSKSFNGSVEVNATIAKMRLVSIAEEIIAVLAADPNAKVKITLEIEAEFPSGATDQTKRAVSENATSLGFKLKQWE